MNPEFQPAGSNVFAAAVQWLDATLLGSIATAIAVLAIASVGFLLMTGRIDLRRAAQIMVGCFILFGASSIAAGFMHAVGPDGTSHGVREAPLLPATYPITSAQVPVQAVAYDPYAGAALPTSR